MTKKASKKRDPLPQAADVDHRISHELTEILTYAVTNSPATVVITDVNGNIEYVNRKFCKLTGYAASEALNRNASMLNSGHMPKKFYRSLWGRLTKGKSWTGEFHNRKKNGEPYWEQAAISPVRDDKGCICHYLKIAEDITRRKQLESDLRASVENLRRHEAQLQDTCTQLAATTRALKRSERKLQRLSQEDALTGLLNRRGFTNELRRARALAEREGHAIGVLILDIDHFKQINDEHGHETGDLILKTYALLLQSHLRASDLICRYGGDEIVIALPAADADTTRLTALRILTAVRQHNCAPTMSPPLSVTVSIGAACGRPVEGLTFEELLKQADRALYQVKRNGRNGMAFWPPEGNGADEAGGLPAPGRCHPFRQVIQSLVAMLDAREKPAGGHSKRVAQLAGELAKAMKRPRDQIDRITQGALLHDIGKIAFPDSLLQKTEPLTAGELKIFQSHPQTGYDILRSNPDFREIADIVFSHQERYDGSGYPRGLKGGRICLGARIFAVADTYDALRCGRPPATPLSAGQALQEIQNGRGSLFDPAVVDALVHSQARLESVLKAER